MMDIKNTSTSEQIVADRIDHVRKMHELVCSLNHEGAYEWWSADGVPDCPIDPDDFRDFAEDDEMYEELIGLFLKILAKYGKYGFVTKKG